MGFGLKWKVEKVKFDALALIEGTGDFRLTMRDGSVLALLFDRHFLQSRHFTHWAGFPGVHKFHKRMLRLYQHGLVARTMLKSPLSGSREYVYGLTRLGLEVVARGMIGEGSEASISEDARMALTNGWIPPYLSSGVRNNPVHEVATADLCLGLSQYVHAGGLPIESVGSRGLVEHYTIRGRGPHVYRVSPDASVWLGDSGKEILIELQRSITPKELHRLARKYQNYFMARRQRDAFFKEPLILVSVDDVANSQEYWRDPYGKTLELVSSENMEGALFIPESRWRNHDWTVDQIGRRGGPVKFLDVVLA